MVLCCLNPLRWHLAEWHRKTELLGRYLTPDEAMGLQKHLDGCLTSYLVLSNMAVEAQELLFPCRPKLHVTQHAFINVWFPFFRMVLFTRKNVLSNKNFRHTRRLPTPSGWMVPVLFSDVFFLVYSMVFCFHRVEKKTEA